MASSDGHRIGQWHPGKKSYINQNYTGTVVIEHSQTEPKYSQADPYYIMLSQVNNDGLCISAISVSNTKISGLFWGDIGYKCGQTWFANTNRIGDTFRASKCVWLDADHENDINARAMSFHLNDIVFSDEKLEQYKEYPDTLCKSTPRFSFWGNLLPDGTPPFFQPPLRYKDDNGADEDMSRVLDDPEHPWDKGAWMIPQKVNLFKRHKPKARPRNGNKDPSHLIISDQQTNVQEICDSDTSYGWDIVSTRQGIFCDMEHHIAYPLCKGGHVTKCFDLENKTLVPARGLNLRDLEVQKLRFGRSYNTTDRWEA